MTFHQNKLYFGGNEIAFKQVPHTTQVKIDPNTGTLIREGVPFIMNPFDTHAVEESLRLKDTQVEVFCQAFLGLSPDDQKALADRIINRKS
jgi:hypothetical protein